MPYEWPGKSLKTIAKIYMCVCVYMNEHDIKMNVEVSAGCSVLYLTSKWPSLVLLLSLDKVNHGGWLSGRSQSSTWP